MNSRWPMLVAGIGGLTAVAIGAFAAHGLSAHLGSSGKALISTAFEYHMAHSLAILAVAVLMDKTSSHLLLSVVVIAFAVGVVLFSGSLYLMAITKMTDFAFITPIGGVSFLIGWLSLIFFALRRPTHENLG